MVAPLGEMPFFTMISFSALHIMKVQHIVENLLSSQRPTFWFNGCGVSATRLQSEKPDNGSLEFCSLYSNKNSPFYAPHSGFYTVVSWPLSELVDRLLIVPVGRRIAFR
jgi:hypothetical protein